jgi:electron transport complex protein RnfD
MATPLNKINEASAHYLPSLLDMFLGRGNCGGALGEVCKLAILLGFAYLLIRRVITWHAPVSFIGSAFLLSWVLSGNFTFALYHLLAGSLLFGAIFMATDYVTTPINKLGKVVFGLGCGVITVLIRFYGAYPEGVSFAILFMNILSPFIEKWTKARPLGTKRGGATK